MIEQVIVMGSPALTGVLSLELAMLACSQSKNEVNTVGTNYVDNAQIIAHKSAFG